MLSREYGGLNLPESIYQMMVEIVARAESGLMTVYGLQEIASLHRGVSATRRSRPASCPASRAARSRGRWS